MAYFKNNVALRYGVKSAIIAQYLWDCLYVVKKSECHIAKFVVKNGADALLLT